MNMGYRINRLKYLVLGIIFFVLGIGEGMAQASFASDANYSTTYYNKSMYSSSNLKSGQYFKLSVTIESMEDIELRFLENKKSRKVKFKIHATFYSDKSCQEPALQNEQKKITIHRRSNAGVRTDDIIIADGSSSGSIDVDYTVIDGGKTRFFGLTHSFYNEQDGVDLTLNYFFDPCSGLVTPSIIGETNLCAGEKTTLSVENQVSGETYHWSKQNDSNWQIRVASSIEVTEAGVYTVKAKKGICESAESDGKEITVKEKPATPSIIGETNLCAGEKTTLSVASTVDGAKYQWQKMVLGRDNSWTSLSEMTKNLQVTETGTYRVTVSNNNNCSATSAWMVVSVHALPKPSIQQVGSELRAVNASSGKHQWQWYLDKQKIEGATSTTYVPTQTGKYTVMTTNEHDCSGMSEPYEFKTTRVRRSLDGEFMIYPNPNEGHFWIKKPSEVEIAELRVYDMLGREYHRVKTKQTEVNIPGLAGGMYFLEIITEPQKGYAPSRTKKFIVK